MKRKLNLYAIAVTLIYMCLFALPVNATTEGTSTTNNHTVLRTDTAIFTAEGTNSDMNDASVLSVAGSDFIEAQVRVKRYRSSTGHEELRIYFAVHDISDSNTAIEDTIEFIFDRLHDHGNTGSTGTFPDDRMIRIERIAIDCLSNCPAARVSRSGILNEFAGSGTAIVVSNSAILSNNPGEYSIEPVGFNLGWTGEMVLTPADLGWSTFPQVMGFAVRASSGNQNAIDAGNPLPGSPAVPVASYPLDGANIVTETNPDIWANLKMRYPIEYAISLDYSGSMRATDGDTLTRWERAKRATDLFVATLGLFKDEHNVIGDTISVSQYSWGCSGSDTTGNVSGVSGAETPIPDPSDSGSYTEGNNDNPPSNNCTPILRGIEYALEDQLSFSSPGSDLKDRITLLLSDGFHNRPSGTSTDFKNDPGSFFTANQKDFTQLRTVAMGPDGTAGTDLLSAISLEFQGGDMYAHEAKYVQTSNFNELMDAFIETLEAPLTVNEVAKVGINYTPGAPDLMVFIGVWDTAVNANELTVMAGGAPATGTVITNTDIGYAAFVVKDPPANVNWTVSTGGAAPDYEFALMDLRILARFLVEQKSYYAGDSMLLQVSLKDNAQPILGATVTADIAKPGEGLGDYLSQIQPDCGTADPQIPGRGHDRPYQYLLASQIKYRTDSTSGTAAATSTVSGSTSVGDPVTGRHALAAHHFARCQNEGLDRDNLPGVQLYDDGTHGDPLPNDGVYSLSYALDEEGTYNMRFFAVGQTSDGMDFSRTRRISQYASIRPDEESTQTQTQNMGISNGLVNYAVYFLPQDNLGNYMGPGFKTKFKLSTSSGVFASEVVDLNNGYYAQLIRYPQGSPEPTVTITTTDGCFEKTVGDTPSISKLIWFLLFIILLLFILWLLCQLRKRN